MLSIFRTEDCLIVNMKRSPLRHVDRFLADYTASHTRERSASQLPSEGLKMPQKEYAGNYRACTYENLDVQLRAKTQCGFVLESCVRSTVWHEYLQEYLNKG